MKRRSLSAFLVIIIAFSCFSFAFAENTTPVITKNPSSEAIAIGGKTWFIAHADYAASMSWEIVDPSGYLYTLADVMSWGKTGDGSVS